MFDVLKSEFRLRNVGFGHNKPEVFYTSQVSFFFAELSCTAEHIIISLGKDKMVAFVFHVLVLVYM